MRKRLIIASLATATLFTACTSTVPDAKSTSPSTSSSASASAKPEKAVVTPRTLAKDKITEPMPANVDEFGGISLGKDLRAGTKNEGAKVVRVFSDPYCPFCIKFETQYGKELEDLAKAGKITLVYHPNYRFQDIKFSTQSLQALYWVAAHEPDKFVAFQHALYGESAPKVTAEKRTEPDVAVIKTAADKAGIAPDKFANMQTMIQNDVYKKLLMQTREQFLADGFKYIPAVMIDGNAYSNISDGRFAPVMEELKK
ncbi:DsbA family protein [Actinotignum urinale]|uniref:DsbA family protein n=1 Tax=Actinotignum urinale TaxID=190146 RepID=UPI00370D0D1D